MRYTITPEQLNHLIEFAEDDRAEIDFDAIEALNYLHQAVQRHAMKRLSGAMKRNEMLNDRLSRIQEKNRQKYLKGDFGDTEIDSVTVAKALLYQLQQQDIHGLTQGKFLAMLFRMYATWLYKQKERLFSEQPLAREFGPQFYRVCEHVNITSRMQYKDYKALAELDPARAAFCKRYAEKHYADSYGELHDPIIRSQAYQNATRERNNGKWNKPLADADIFLWRESLEPAGSSKTKQQ